MTHGAVPETEIPGGKFSKRNIIHALILVVFLVPLNYALIVTLKPSLPAPAASNTATPAPASTNTANRDSYLSMGLNLYNNADYPGALKAWQKALEYDPKYELTYNNIAVAYGKMGDWEGQKKYCEMALAIKPDFELAKTNLFQANEALKKKQK
jgi:tetratricopeptide (TPR) repeat protein